MGANNITGENAADRMTYVGEVYSIGEAKRKQDVLDSLPAEWSTLHRDGHIYLHDLDAYGLTYNCLALDLRKFLPFERFVSMSKEAKIIGVFDFLKEFLTKLGNEQSGGMAFTNFDIEIADVFTRLDISLSDMNNTLFRAAMGSFFAWCNNSHERMGKVSYYVSLNLGLADTETGRYVCRVVLEEFANSPATIFKPNIIFKVKKGVNAEKGDPNYMLFQSALRATTIKMIPTYVLCDSIPNVNTDPIKLAVMGCRTRVVDNKNGPSGSIGRGNIAYVSVNLPRLAMETVSEGAEGCMDRFLQKWDKVAEKVSEILEARYRSLIDNRTTEDFRTNSQYGLWCVPFAESTLDETFRNGTLSIGFIGLSETVEILTGKKIQKSHEAYAVAKSIVEHMRDFVNSKRDTTRFNYSLLATSGELISGKFTEIDAKKGFNHEVMKKGFYTNSFHIEVDSEISAFDKIAMEAPFHLLCNGGCISYVEFREAPVNNEKALEELVNHAISHGTHYLGFNFDLDVCESCGNKGIFDKCPICGSKNVIKVRRVSGYLEVLDFFTNGKKKEVVKRRKNE